MRNTDLDTALNGDIGTPTDDLRYAMDVALAFAPPTDSEEDDPEEEGRNDKVLVSVTYDAEGLTRPKQVARELSISALLKKSNINYLGTGKMAASGDPHRQCIFVSPRPIGAPALKSLEKTLRAKIDPGISIDVTPVRYK